jgi:hypothetical protein
VWFSLSFVLRDIVSFTHTLHTHADVRVALNASQLALNPDRSVFALMRTNTEDEDVDRVRAIAARLFQEKDQVKRKDLQKK